jgi:hypothetical protein
MYKLTLILFAFFSLVLPILAVPVPASEAVDGQSITHTGRVRVIHSHRAHDADLSAPREPGMNLASVIVAKPITGTNSSSLLPSRYMIKAMIAARCVSSLNPSKTRL